MPVEIKYDEWLQEIQKIKKEMRRRDIPEEVLKLVDVMRTGEVVMSWRSIHRYFVGKGFGFSRNYLTEKYREWKESQNAKEK